MSIKYINLADIVDPQDPSGRTYRQINAAMVHSIPVGSLVEIIDCGVRLFVMKHTRDCDMTPLYSLGPYDPFDDKEDDEIRRMKWDHGYSERSLTLIERPPVDSENH